MKKAIASNKLIVILIVIVVIVILIITTSLKGTEIKNRYGALLPFWNFSSPDSDQIELIRYDITSGNVQWYSGISWKDFLDGKAKFKNKGLLENSLKNEIESYYFNNEERGNPAIKINKEQGEYVLNYLSNDATIEALSKNTKGDVIIKVDYIESNGLTKIGYIKIDPFNKISIRTDSANNFFIGEIRDFSSVPKIQITNSNQDYITISPEVLKILNELNGMSFPCGGNEISQTLKNGGDINSIKCFNVLSIRLDNNYEFKRNGEATTESANYQLYQYNDLTQRYQSFEIYLQVENRYDNVQNTFKTRLQITTDHLLGDYRKINPKKTEQQLIQDVIFWKDSIFKKPVKISYKENNLDTSNYFCVKKDRIYLVIYLTQPVAQDETCEQ